MSESELILLEVRADLDVPGETGRQTRVLLLWLACLAFALVVAALRRDVPAASGSERYLIALGLGLALPGALTSWLAHRRRRGGPHARGIVIDVTSAGELRLWGRGYGQRTQLEGAKVSERLLDVYCGRLGAWRQRRLRVEPHKPAGGRYHELELATPADDEDLELGLTLAGGEGDCVELTRADFRRVRALVLELAASEPRPEADPPEPR